MVHSPNDALQSHKVSGQNSPRGRASGQKSLKNSEILEKLSPARGGGGYWGGRPLWDISTYLHQHRREITQTFMVDSPSDALQTHKVSGQNSSRGGVGGPGRSLARDLRTTGAVRVRHADHWGRVRATCGPQMPCVRYLRTTIAVRRRPAEHLSRARATC